MAIRLSRFIHVEVFFIIVFFFNDILLILVSLTPTRFAETALFLDQFLRTRFATVLSWDLYRVHKNCK